MGKRIIALAIVLVALFALKVAFMATNPAASITMVLVAVMFLGCGLAVIHDPKEGSNMEGKIIDLMLWIVYLQDRAFKGIVNMLVDEEPDGAPDKFSGACPDCMGYIRGREILGVCTHLDLPFMWLFQLENRVLNYQMELVRKLENDRSKGSALYPCPDHGIVPFCQACYDKYVGEDGVPF